MSDAPVEAEPDEAAPEESEEIAPDADTPDTGPAEGGADEPTAAGERETPSSLVGSGAKMFKARANVVFRGLGVGDVGTFADDDEEARANLVSGNLDRVED